MEKEEKQKNNKGKRHKKKNNKILVVIRIVLVIAAITSATYILLYFYNSYKNKNLYADILPNIQENRVNETGQESSVLVSAVKELQKENADIKGWIKIDGTNINYPLLQTTDNDYYVTRNYKKEKSKYGSIFINSNSDLKDEKSHVLIYGHDMKDGQMFAGLINYTNKAFYEENLFITIATDEKEEKYKIICVFKSRQFYEDETGVFRYYRYFNFNTQNELKEYINNCKKEQLYDTKTDITDNQIITLTTCEYSQDNGRLVVVAQKI